MLIDCKKFSFDQIYFLMIQTIVPRPIAWVLSDNGNATYNLAPFSFFNGICSEPPLLMISVGHKEDGSRKDTWVNIDERQDFVVHITSGAIAETVVASSAELVHGDSEVTKLNIPLAKVEGQRLPRVAVAKAALFCQKYAIHEVGSEPQGLILGEIKHMWFDDAVIEERKGRLVVNSEKLDPLARLGGSSYALLGKQLTIRRPD